MRWALVAWLCACGSPSSPAGGAGSASGRAAAAPAVVAAAPAAPSPNGATACLDLDKLPDSAHQLVAAMESGLLRICLENAPDDKRPQARACVALDLSTGAPSKASDGPVAPEAKLPAGTLEDRDGKPVACGSDGTCALLGKRLRRFLASHKDDARSATVTTDAAVVAAGNQVWSVRKDRRVAITPPRDTHEYAPFGSYTTAGRFVIGEWTPCAADCKQYRVFAPDGRIIVDQISTEGRPHVLDATRWGALSNTLEVFDLTTGKRRSRIEVFPSGKPAAYTAGGVAYVWEDDPEFRISPEESSAFVPLSPGRIAIVFIREPVVTIVDLDRATVASRIRIPVCDRAADAARDAVGGKPSRP